MAVRIRMKRLGRTHRPFYRICAMDQRSPRDGKAIEELGTYDPMVADTDARCVLKAERIDYWLSVGALPSERVATLIKKYGTGGTHVEQAEAARQKLSTKKTYSPTVIPVKKAEEPVAEEAPAEEAAEAPAEETAEATESSES